MLTITVESYQQRSSLQCLSAAQTLDSCCCRQQKGRGALHVVRELELGMITLNDLELAVWAWFKSQKSLITTATYIHSSRVATHTTPCHTMTDVHKEPNGALFVTLWRAPQPA